jgi:hypothetical protein
VNVEEAADPTQLVGRSREQVDEFVSEVVAPLRDRFGPAEVKAELRV